MPTPPKPPSGSPLDSARAAFDPLSTPDKTAFVVQATFETIGQALAETGRSVADAIHTFDLDTMFAARPPSMGGRPAPPPAAPTAPPPVPPRPPIA